MKGNAPLKLHQHLHPNLGGADDIMHPGIDADRGQIVIGGQFRIAVVLGQDQNFAATLQGSLRGRQRAGTADGYAGGDAGENDSAPERNNRQTSHFTGTGHKSPHCQRPWTAVTLSVR